jgi:uncharacterized protein involved in outer membrane biogenesis
MQGARDDGGTEPRRRSRLPRLMVVLGAVALVLALLVVGVGFGAERWVNARKDAALAELSAELGRPVTAGQVRLALLRGRVEVEDIVVGRDPAVPDEPDPAFRLDRAYVDVLVRSVLTSLGKRVVVQDIAIERPLIQVSRDRQGRLNWQQIAERMDQGEPKKSEPMDPATRERLNGVVIRTLRVADARLRLVDLTRASAAVEISDLDFLVRELSLARPFEAQISAAVLATRPNFDLRARFAAAATGPEGLPTPPLERLTVKLEPVPLAPLSSFAASLLGAGLDELAEGKLAIDLQAVAGAAAPGGRGPTSLRGFVALEAIRFAGGEKFDARLDTDLAGNFDQGTVDITELRAKLGTMGLRIQGRITELLGAPRVERFTLESEGLDFTRLRAHYPPLDRVAGAELRGPFTVEARGDGSAEEQRLQARLDFTPASVNVPGQLRKAAGTPLTLELRAKAAGEQIRVERLALTLAKVVLQGAGSLRTQGTGKGARRTFEGSLDAPLFALREVGALVAPRAVAGLPDLRLALKARARGTVGKPETLHAEIPSLRLLAGRSDLDGRLELQNLKQPRITFAGRSKYLDLDDFLPATDKATSARPDRRVKTESPAKTTTGAKTAAEPLPPMLRDLLGTLELSVERGRAAGIDYRDLRTDVSLKEGRLQARTLEVGALGGRFSGAGSELPILGGREAFVARGQVEGLDVAAVIGHFVGESGILTGRLSGKIDLHGRGVEPKELLDSLSGDLSGELAEGQFLPASLLAPVVDALENASRAAAVSQTLRGIRERAVAVLRDRRLGDVGGALRFAQGALQITRPLEASTPSGPLTLKGRIGLDGQADLDAELALTPETASALLAGRARFDAPIPVQMKIEGPLKRPRIRPTQPTQLAKVFLAALVRSEAGQAAQARAAEVAARATNLAREQAASAAEAAARSRKAAEERARQEAEKAREAAGRRLRGILGR